MSHAALKTVWRFVLVILLLASVPLYVLEFTLYNRNGNLGFFTNYAWADAPGLTAHVTAVRNGSQAWREGIRVGDAIPLATTDRIALTFPVAGDHLRLTYLRRGVARRAEVVALPSQPPVTDYLVSIVIIIAVSFCLFVFGLLVVVRAWENEHGPAIATILTGFVVGGAASLWGIGAFPIAARSGPEAALWVIANELGLMGTFSVVMLMALLCQIVGEPGRLLRGLTWLSALILAVLGVGYPAALALSLLGRAGLPADYFSEPAYYFWASFFVAIIGLFVALNTARGESRQRVRWLVWGFAPYFASFLLFDVVNLFLITNAFVAAHLSLFFYATRLLGLALPVALIYGVLFRRVIDIGFVINRVAIYGVLSIVLISVFTLLEYVAGKFFLETSRAGSLAIQFGVALVIGFSARYLHNVVDRFVDRVLFAKRNADESALRHIAREAEAYASADMLLDRAMGVLRDHSEARGIAIYVTEDGAVTAVRASDPAFPTNVDLDDPLLVKLRRWNEPVDTHEVTTAFPDGMVFPMCVRGKLVGALACQTKRDSTAFDPDERESLSEVARGVGAALDLLESRSDGVTAALQNSIAALTDAVASLGKRFELLSDTILLRDRGS
jgi:hypothetical protein